MGDLIQVVQLPIIEERLHALKEKWEEKAAYAESVICTDETIKAVKASRAEMRKEFEEIDAMRKQAKQAIMEPYTRLEAVIKDCVTSPFSRADKIYSGKIEEYENSLKEQCEAELREYFAELCAAHHLEWLRYEQAGIAVDMASAKAKTPKRLMDYISAFVAGVSDSVNRISSLDDAEEIMVEYMRTLDAAGAICTVQERHRRIKEQKAAQEARKEDVEREAEAVEKVEALSPPVEEEPLLKCVFTVHATKTQLRKLKEFLIMEGIKYE